MKIVRASELARLEKQAEAEGASEEAFMEVAATAVAEEVALFQEERQLEHTATLLIGKGNNGADAYLAGVHLLEWGFSVQAITICSLEEASPLHQKQATHFLEAGGQIFALEEGKELQGILVDGLLGAGFKGEIRSPLKEWIQKINEARLPLVSVDIPSGVNGDTGEVSTAIIADVTVCLGLAKEGLFLEEGGNCAGHIIVRDFGLPAKQVEQAESTFTLWDGVFPELPRIKRNRHKYEAGYVVGLSGSSQFVGAPKLSGMAALSSGAGIVRIFHEGTIEPYPAELIFTSFDKESWEQELRRARAVFVGPGSGLIEKKLIESVQVPCVLDADALQPGVNFPKGSILTPHRGEALRLLEKDYLNDRALWEHCQQFVDEKECVFLLKGAPNVLFVKGKKPLVIARGDPGMATAGSGDVLTGVIASFLAQGMEREEAALLGVLVHALAGEAVAREKGSYGLVAHDLIDAIPYVLKEHT